MDKKKKAPSLWQAIGAKTSDVQGGTSDVSLCVDYSKLDAVLQQEIDTRFTEKKLFSLSLSDVYHNIGLISKAHRVSDCGTFLDWKLYQAGWKLTNANFCKDRLCAMCNWRRSLKIFGQVSQIMDILDKDYQFIFLTMTVKNCYADELNYTLNMMMDGWKKLRKKLDRGPFSNDSVVGSIRAVEITYKLKDGTYHPHIHVIFAVRHDYFKHNYISQAKWQDVWQECCGLDYNPICFVEKVKDCKKGVAEIAKYAVKGSDIFSGTSVQIEDKVRTLISSLTGRRLIGFTGVFRDAKRQLGLDDIESGDLVNTDNNEMRDDVVLAITRFRWGAGFYMRET